MINVYLRILGHILVRPKYRRYLDGVEIELAGEYKDIYEIVKRYPGEEMIMPSYLVEKGIDKKLSNLIYPIMSEMMGMQDMEAYSDLYNCLLLVDEDNRKRLAIKVIDEAREEIMRGELSEAIYKLKGLKYPPTKRIKKFGEIGTANDNTFRTGIDDIDEGGGLALGNMLVLSGDTGSMKTMITLWMSLSILNNTEYRVGYFEKEMLPRDIVRRVISNISGKSLNEVMSMGVKEYERLHEETYEKHKGILDRFVIVPNDVFDNVLDMAKIIENEGINVFVLDFFTQLGQDRMDRDFTTFTMAQSNMLKEMINTTNTLGIVITQLRKNSARSRFNKIPQLDDIEWSGSISQYASYVYSTFYPKLYYEKMSDRYFYLINGKNRHNAVKDVCLYAYPSHCNFLEPESSEKIGMLNWLASYRQKVSGNG